MFTCTNSNFNPECQGERIKHGQCSRGYDTMKSDVWSLGIILINLTAGRNPWKQANLQNASFAAYLRNPRHFFRSILPCISEELEYILLDIFCLDPALRISLSELRLHIFRCQSFVQQTIPATKYVPNCNSQKSYKTFDSDPTIHPTIKFVGDYTDDRLDYVKNTAAFIDISTDITSQPKDHLCDTKYPSNIIQNPYTNQQCYSTSNTSISSSCSSLDGYLAHYRDDMVYCS